MKTLIFISTFCLLACGGKSTSNQTTPQTSTSKTPEVKTEAKSQAMPVEELKEKTIKGTKTKVPGIDREIFIDLPEGYKIDYLIEEEEDLELETIRITGKTFNLLLEETMGTKATSIAERKGDIASTGKIEFLLEDDEKESWVLVYKPEPSPRQFTIYRKALRISCDLDQITSDTVSFDDVLETSIALCATLRE